MTDETRDVLDRLARLEAGQTQAEARLANLEAGQARLEAGQARLEAGMEALQAGQSDIRQMFSQLLPALVNMTSEMGKLRASVAEINGRLPTTLAYEMQP